MRVGELLSASEINVTSILRQPEEVDEATVTPLTFPQMEPEEVSKEVPEEFHHAPALKRKGRRVARSKRNLSATAVSVRRSGEDKLVFAIKVAAANTSGPAVHEALRYPMREGWVDAMDSEIDTITDNSGCLQEEIDESKPYDLIHTTMQLQVKMKDAETIEKLKVRLCA